MCLELDNAVPSYSDRAVQKGIPLDSGEYIWYYADSDGPDDTYIDLGSAHWCISGDYEASKSSFTHERVGNRVTVRASHVPAWREEPLSLPDSTARLQLWRYYDRAPSCDVSWKEFARSYRESRLFAIEVKEWELIHSFAERFRSLGNDREKAQTVYAWLQDSIVNVSYFRTPPKGLVNAKGKPVSKFKEHKYTTDVLKERYGGWLTIDLLYYRILQALTIHSFPVLVVDRSSKPLAGDCIFWQFDRLVIAVTDNSGETSYCTPGDWGFAFGQRHWNWEASDALSCDIPAGIERLGFSAPEKTLLLSNYSLTLDTTMVVSGTMRELHNGHKARLCEVRALAGNAEEVEQMLRDSLRTAMPNSQCSRVEFSLDSSNAEPFESRYTLTFESRPVTSDDTVRVEPLRYARNPENIFTSPTRLKEVNFQYAYREVDSVHITLPGSCRVVDIPSDTTLGTDAGSCSVKFSVDDSGLIAVREFVVNKPRLAASEYQSLRELFVAREAVSRKVFSVVPK